MTVSIIPSQLSGEIIAPASKSSMQRACAAALLHTGTTIIQNPGTSNDDLAAIELIKNLGAIITHNHQELHIISKGINENVDANTEDVAVNCGESGLGIRMFTPIIALSNKKISINGKGSLLSRPMDFFDTTLPQLGVDITSNNGKLPLKIQGPLLPKEITVDGSLSSQFLTGLLFAYSSSVKTPTNIIVTNLKSKPYIDLSLQVLTHFGYHISQQNHETFTIEPKQTDTLNKTIEYTVEGDWSGAAFLLVAGAIAGNICVKGLDVFSTQADKAILQALMDSGCRLSVTEKEITVAKSPLANGLVPFHFNATDCPDLFPPLVALAAFCNGKTVFEGVNRLAHKESNRGLTLQEEFGKLGIKIHLQDDLMIVEGGTIIKEATVHSHHDHRIAMACAITALNAKGIVTIENADAINKSYPQFYLHLQQLGAKVLLP